MLATNFSQCGAATPAALVRAERAVRAFTAGATSDGSAALAMLAPATAKVGQRFTVALEVEAGLQPVDGAAAYVNFDPQVLQVEEVTAGSKLGVELLQQVDNAVGTVDYAAATFQNFPTGSFALATVQFRALKPAAVTLLTLHRLAPRQSDATFGGRSVLGASQEVALSVAGPEGETHAPGCLGDCDGNGQVSVEELVEGVAIALGRAEPEHCRALDRNADGMVTIDEVLAAVDEGLRGCSAAATASQNGDAWP